MQVITQPTGPVEANCYIVVKDQKALMIDPGDDAEILKGMIKSLNAELQAVLLTNAHFDHCSAVDEILEEFGVDVYMNPLEFDFLADPAKNSSAAFYGFPPLKLNAKPLPLKDGEQKIGSFEVKAWSAPGHSIGSTIIQIEDCLFTGDVLFAGSIGRTDLKTGNADQMKESLSYLKNLSGNFEVYPGHGPATTLAWEKTHNPYLMYSLI